jgi:hypothetical protein
MSKVVDIADFKLPPVNYHDYKVYVLLAVKHWRTQAT